MAERPYAVEFTAEARADLKALRAADSKRVLAAVTTGLQHGPFEVTRHRKPLDDIEPAFAFEPPLWELRVGDFRVFYDGMAGADRTVTIRAIRRKGQTQTTQEIVS